jgi:hypothetical protein
MGGFLLTAMSGWLALTAFATTLVVPLGVKVLRIGGRARRHLMTLHYALGVAVPVLALAHASIPMRVSGISVSMGLGLVFATTALSLLLLQAAVGISLRRATVTPPLLRSAHFTTMLALAALIATHVLINRT